MTFYQDLEFGENNERLVLKKIQVKYPKAYKVEGYCKEWDIYIPEKGIGIEVKSDRVSYKTGNVAIECSYGGEPSGIEATKAAWWVYVTKCHLYWIRTEKIKKCIEDNDLKPIDFSPIGGDYKPKALYLIKEKVFKKYTTSSNRHRWQKLM
jgi:hypothetical protein